MKNKKNILNGFVVLSVSALTMALLLNRPTENLGKVEAYDTASLPTTINLNDCSDDEIKNYYSSLSSMDASELKGMNLLKNLKTILKNGQKYYSYDTDSSGAKIWKIYEIADRDWEKSPASEISGYNSGTNTITGYSYGSSATNSGTNPYIHALYVNRSVNNNVRAWAKTDTTSTSHGNNAEWCIDREHIWPKSQGFNAEGKGGARGDPMHLWPGDSDVNSSLHNDQLYGFVNITSSTKAGKWSYAKDNYVGDSLTLGAAGSANYVFEPQDCDKGDIARAIFYMVARYNYLSGSDSDGIDANNPNLALAQTNIVASGWTSSTTETGKMGVLTDLLEWHHLDPVDDFEIHRNNLLFRNFTNNRNPFIDYPQWVDYIWGTATYDGRSYQSYDSTPTGNVNLATDIINYGKAEDKAITKIEITKGPDKTEYQVGEEFDKTGMAVTATYEDSTTEDVTSKCSVTVDMSTAGEKDVTVTYKGKSATLKINVTAKRGIDMKIIIIIVVVVVVILLVIGISAGVVTVNKKGKIKVKKPKTSNSKKKTKK